MHPRGLPCFQPLDPPGPTSTLYRIRSCSPSCRVVPSGLISFTKAMEKTLSLLSLARRQNPRARGQSWAQPTTCASSPRGHRPSAGSGRFYPALINAWQLVAGQRGVSRPLGAWEICATQVFAKTRDHGRNRQKEPGRLVSRLVGNQTADEAQARGQDFRPTSHTAVSLHCSTSDHPPTSRLSHTQMRPRD